MPDSAPAPSQRTVVAIACGGTGGHLFPGLAVAEELLRRDCAVTLMVSPKDVDQQAIKSISDMGVATLPAVGLTRGGLFGFALGFWKSYQKAKNIFSARPPQLVLAMGGFISAPPVMAGKRFGAKTFLHESNTIPGRANRWLSSSVDGAFVYFQQTAARLKARRVEVVGMPVRPQFMEAVSQAAARAALGLDESAPVLLVMGGSQGASKINELILSILPQLAQAVPTLQFIHLTGLRDAPRATAAYAASGSRAVVKPFLSEMGLALAAADLAVSRAGASSLAELAARQLPAVLIPYPSAADDHQYHNARAFVQSGAARALQQNGASPDQLALEILGLLRDPRQRASMQSALAQWHKPAAASDIVDFILHWDQPALEAGAAAARAFKAPKMGASHA